MKLNYLAAIAAASIVGFGAITGISYVNPVQAQANPCAAVDPCAGANPCAGVNPCASVDPCAGANPCASVDPCAGANPCAAQDEVSVGPAPQIYSDISGLAIRGTDPVAYFTESQAVPGSSEYTYEWMGTTWQFSSAANRDLFVSNPEAYAPQYGGYCAKAVSEGNLASIDPEAWYIEEGRLYLNYSLEVQQQWFEDIPGNIARADAFWPEVLNVGIVHE